MNWNMMKWASNLIARMQAMKGPPGSNAKFMFLITFQIVVSYGHKSRLDISPTFEFANIFRNNLQRDE